MKEIEETEGTKDSKSKLHYELDWEFIKLMAERMSSQKIENGGKYDRYNWKKPIDVQLLKDALLRHTLELISNEDLQPDDNREYGHLESIALNAMLIYYQLKNNVN